MPGRTSIPGEGTGYYVAMGRGSRSRQAPGMAAPPVPSRLIPMLAVATLGIFVATTPLAPSARAAIIEPFTPHQTIALSPGIDYVRGTMRTSGGRIQSVRVATVDASDPRAALRSLLSNDRVVGKELPSRLAQRKSTPMARAMVATNGDRSVFGRLDAYAAPHSMHISNGELMVARACTRPTLGIDSTGEGRIDDVRVSVTVQQPQHRDPRTINRVNTHRDDSLVVLYTNRFGRRTGTRSGGTEVIISLPRTLAPSDSQPTKVLRVRRGGGNTWLRAGEAVISVKGSRGKWVRQLRVGQRMDLKTSIVRNVDGTCGGTLRVASGWDDIVEAMGGNFYVARNGQVNAPSGKTYRPSVQRHPRTSVGVTADGRILMVTVDGRQAGYSVGVTLAEMGRLMLSLGARHALNLDGGGSTVMAKRNLATGAFSIANRPSDGRERVHSQALTAFELAP